MRRADQATGRTSSRRQDGPARLCRRELAKLPPTASSDSAGEGSVTSRCHDFHVRHLGERIRDFWGQISLRYSFKRKEWARRHHYLTQVPSKCPSKLTVGRIWADNRAAEASVEGIRTLLRRSSAWAHLASKAAACNRVTRKLTMSATHRQRLRLLSKFCREVKSISVAAELSRPIPPSNVGSRQSQSARDALPNSGWLIEVARADSRQVDQAWAVYSPVGRVVRATQGARD